MSGAVTIDASRELGLGLGAIHCRVCGGVDDDIGRLRADVLAHRATVGDIEVIVRGCHELCRGRRGSDQAAPDLATGPGDEDLHGKYSASLKRFAAESLVDNTGSTPAGRGHFTLRSGSFH